MELFLVRHGEALSIEKDIEEKLSSIGEKEAGLLAEFLFRLGIHFDCILSSPKKRTQQTASILAKAVQYPLIDIVTTEKLKALTPATETIKELKQYFHLRKILVVGHLPNLRDIASLLLCPCHSIQINFTPCCCVSISCENLKGGSIVAGKSTILWMMPPQNLRKVFD